MDLSLRSSGTLVEVFVDAQTNLVSILNLIAKGVRVLELRLSLLLMHHDEGVY